MPSTQVQKLIIRALREAKGDLSLNELVASVQANIGRHQIKAAVVPLLYLRQIILTPARKFRIAS